MTLKKTAASKRATPPRRSDYKNDFLKDWARLARSGKYDLNRLKEAMLLLISGSEPLPQRYRDHALEGNWSGYRECHVGGDFLLIYRVDDTRVPGYIIFQAAGTHAELFGK